MRIDGSAVHYLLGVQYEGVVCDKPSRLPAVDYPILYEEGSDMRGHTVLVPEHERLTSDAMLEGSLCVCMGGASAASASEAGFAVIYLADDVTFAQLYNYMQSVFVRMERLDAQLRAYNDAYMGAQPLLDACAEATGCSLVLVDSQYRGICRSRDDERAGKERVGLAGFGMLEASAVDLFMASSKYAHMRTNRNMFALPGSTDLLMKNIFVNGELVGMLVSRHEDNPSSVRYVRFVLNYLSTFVESAYASLGSFGVTPTGSDRIRAALSELLSGGGANYHDVETLLEENGHALDSRYVVLRIERSFTNEGAEGLGYLARRFELAWPRAYSFVSDEKLFMLADVGHDGAENDAFFKDMLTRARDNLSKVGVSRPFSAMEGLDAARMQAMAALEQGGADDPTYWFYRFDDYALAWILGHGIAALPFAYVAHPAIGVLLRYDAEHGSELLRTLEMFLTCRFNATKASEELFVARSTLLNRLERIVELTGIDLDDTRELVYLGLSFVMRKAEARMTTAP